MEANNLAVLKWEILAVNSAIKKVSLLEWCQSAGHSDLGKFLPSLMQLCAHQESVRLGAGHHDLSN